MGIVFAPRDLEKGKSCQEGTNNRSFYIGLGDAKLCTGAIVNFKTLG